MTDKKPVKKPVVAKAAAKAKPRTAAAAPKPATPVKEGERIAKRLARAGVCSRRDAERLIEEGVVAVDGKIITSPALNVTAKNKITVYGKRINEPDDVRMWKYHKPQGVLTTNRDPQCRPTVFEKLPPDMPRVVTIGRLDFNTEGLLLLTNDGGVARHLELPANAWLRHYRVRVYGTVDPKKLAELGKGVTISGIRYEPMKVVVEKTQGDKSGANVWLQVTIKEGKNREVRKAMEYMGLQVTRLIRVAFGSFLLGGLARGAVEEIPNRILRDMLGKVLQEKP